MWISFYTVCTNWLVNNEALLKELSKHEGRVEKNSQNNISLVKLMLLFFAIILDNYENMTITQY